MNAAGGDKAHWESIYAKKGPAEVSWYQERPGASWELLKYLQIDRSARILDAGGGDSRFVDFLLDQGFHNITVLDISETAIDRARHRLAERGSHVRWIIADLREFQPEEGAFDIWHDRAVLHFFNEEGDLRNYADRASRALSDHGKLIVGTFADTGPDKCSGLNVARYTESSLSHRLSAHFHRLKCIAEDHVTPGHTIQPFLFCAFEKNGSSLAA